jgi:single-strand DNA-binding protein
MAGINKVIILGNIGKIETIESRSGIFVKMSVATSQRYKDKNTGEQKEVTEWHNITIFGRLAEVADKYLSKGSKVYIEGSLKTNKWEDKSGKTQYAVNIVAKELQMLDSKGSNNGHGGGSKQQSNTRQTSDDYRRQKQSSDSLTESDFEDDDLNDIPF